MNAPLTRLPSLADYALLLTLAGIWGASFLLIKIAVATVPPLTLATGRLVVASLVMVVLARMAGQSITADGKTWAMILVTGLIGNAIPFTLINWGEQRIDSGLAAILMGGMPLVTYLIAHFTTTDEKLNAWKAAGVTLGLAGMVVLIGPAKLLTLGQDAVRELAVAAAATCYGIHAILARRLGTQPPLALVAVFMLSSGVFALPLSIVTEHPWTLTPTAGAIAAVLALGLFQTALATVILLTIVRRQGSAFFSQINFLVPLFGMLWGMAILSERPSPQALVALAMVLSGIGLARLGAPRAVPLPKGEGNGGA